MVYVLIGMPFKNLCDKLRSLVFKSKIDYAMWYKKRTDRSGYDYFSHHVDDFLITGVGILDVIAERKLILLLKVRCQINTLV